jgi:hypothetical protein
MIRLFRVRPLPLFLALTGFPACAPAKGPSPLEQPAAYARTPGETLRYQDRLEWSSSYGTRGATEEMQSMSVREARIAIQFTGGDTARAWIESARRATPRHPEEVAGADVLHLPFLLGIGPRGIDTVIQRPTFPDGWERLDQLFTPGYFPRLPGGPLTPGRRWLHVDSVDTSDSFWIGGRTYTGNYRVVDHSVMSGERVAVVEYTLRIESRERMRKSGRYEPGEPPPRPTVLAGSQEEQGRLYFAPRTGRLVLRTRTGVQERSSTTFASVKPSAYRIRYSSTTELISAESR